MENKLQWLGLVTAALLLTGAPLASAEIKNSDCLECHSDKTLSSTNAAGKVKSLYVEPAVLAASIHRTNSCASCHRDLTVKHPDDNVPARSVNCAACHRDPSATYSASVHGAARLTGKPAGAHAAPGCADCHGSHSILPPATPASPLNHANLAATCGRCHETAAADFAASVHGQAVAAGRRDAAVCTDCHSEHQIEGLKGSSPLKISRDICGKCHASQRLNSKYNLPADRATTFFASYHGLAAQYGSTSAANCASCHGAHRILASTDPRSSVHKDNLAATCGKCHPGATANFAQSKVHLDVAATQSAGGIGERANWWARRIYLVMIVVVIGLMVAHNGAIFVRKMIAIGRRQNRPLLRMDASQRVQHVILGVSFVLLAWTGFALKFPDSWLAHLLGSDENFRRWSHRLAGVALLLSGAYHLGYVLLSREGRRLVKDMLPRVKDVRDAAGNARYLAGLGGKRPKFARFGYAEKMEYWAVVWGTIIMGVTGLMIWFKIDVTHFLPRWAVELATTIHYYEAILACLAILVWHFYHVIFDPDVYPMNRAALDGRVSREWAEEEHPLDEALLSDKTETATALAEAPAPNEMAGAERDD